MVENTCSTSETETAIAGLHQWLPRDDGLAWVGMTITQVQVERHADGFVALAFLRDGVVLHSVSISEAGARHLAGLIASPSAGA